MNCPNCQSPCEDFQYFCRICGTRLKPDTQRKGSRLVPALLLILMSAAGLLLFFSTKDLTRPVVTASDGCFTVDRGVLYFDEALYDGTGELEVPAAIDGISVTALSNDCFSGCPTITTVILPDSLTHIGDRAFAECTSLRGIYIPSTVETIGKEAFRGCTGLEAICMHGSIHAIGRHAFDQCTHMKYIIFRGTYAQWTHLYDGYINPSVGVFCEDGSFFQGEDTPQ